MLRRKRQQPEQHEPEAEQAESLCAQRGFHLCEADCPAIEDALVPVCECGAVLAPIVTNGGPRLVVRALACPQRCGGTLVMAGAVLLPGDEAFFQNGEEEAAIQ
jgi:hypothetical protein